MKLKEFIIYNPHSNTDVTAYYVDIIGKCLVELGFNVKNSFKLGDETRDIGIIVVDLKDAIEARKVGYGYVIYWIQGVAPEEIFLKKKDILRYLLYTYREYKALKSADFVFYCSERMKFHYRNKYHIGVNDFYVMPCFNEEINPQNILEKEYKENIFIYAGSMEKWQNFEKTVLYYKSIEDNVHDAVFKVFCKDKVEAERILTKYGIKKYFIDYVNPKQLSDEIKRAKFGFCLREDITVNKVATPTKLSNYISNGVMPIYSECLDSFYVQAKGSRYCFNTNEHDCFSRIIKMCKIELAGEDILEDYRKCFGDYYSSEYHKNKIKEILFNILKRKGLID